MAFELFVAITSLIALIFIFTFHNYFKALTAYKLGDDTPARAGFLTLNPIPHTDPIGTIFLPLIFILLKSPLLIGWPRMVPIDYYKFPNPTKGAIIISIVSILSYFVIGLIAFLLYKILLFLHLPPEVITPLGMLLQFVTIASTFFGFINLLPIPPMDMGILVLLLLGKSIEEAYSYSFFGSILILFLFISGILGALFSPLYHFILNLF
jgi:Zn-dependent protease